MCADQKNLKNFVNAIQSGDYAGAESFLTREIEDRIVDRVADTARFMFDIDSEQADSKPDTEPNNEVSDG